MKKTFFTIVIVSYNAGDKLLIRFADILRSAVRHNDVTGRIGGDEFIAFCLNVTEESILADKAIKHAGAGVTLEEALKPFVIDTGTIKTAFLSFGWDVEETRYASGHSADCAPRDKDVILREVRAAKKMYDRVVVCMHWGFEFNRYPMPYDIDLAHATIDAGADLIIGNHPHCVQPYEEYHGKTIFYSLGNFYFGSKRDMFTKVFPERITNQPDYGILVIYEPGSGMTDTRLIVYSRDENIS